MFQRDRVLRAGEGEGPGHGTPRGRSSSADSGWAAAMGGRILAAGAAVLVLAACASGPAYEGMSADELFQWAQAHYESGDYEDAVEGFEQFLATHTTDPRQAEAQYLLARSFKEKGEELSAVAEFERFQQRWTVHPLSPDVALGICEAYASLSPIPQRDQTYTRQAADACGRTALEFQNHDAAHAADSIRAEMVERLARREYEVGRFYQRRDLHDSALLSFERVLNEFPDSEVVPRALLSKYRSYRAIGWDAEADEAREDLLALFPDTDEARELASDGNGG